MYVCVCVYVCVHMPWNTILSAFFLRFLLGCLLVRWQVHHSVRCIYVYVMTCVCVCVQDDMCACVYGMYTCT